jgi:hypothetical protein
MDVHVLVFLHYAIAHQGYPSEPVKTAKREKEPEEAPSLNPDYPIEAISGA